MTDPVPISLDEARRRKRGGKPPGGTAPSDQRGCPVVALGHADGEFVFLDVTGQVRRLKARALGGRADLVALFGGDTTWLFDQFPRHVKRRTTVAGETVEETETIGFSSAAASEFLMQLAVRAGIFGDHVTFRRNGIWHDATGAPVVHCGDQVLFAGGPEQAGQSIGGAVWTAGPKTPRPAALPAPASVAQGLQDDLQTLWSFKDAGGAIVVLGLIGTGYFGAAASWRSNGYLTGGGGSGKSMLLDVMRACCPLHHYSSDTTKAGIEGAVNGRAMPIFIDESGDRADQTGAQALLDMLLAATGGEGTRGHRGTIDGGVRTINLVGVVTMASVSPPDMKPTHRGRITLVELNKPGAGVDNRVAMEALATAAHGYAAALWARALAGWDRWRLALARFREALGSSGCAPREMDQLGSILAGWWVLTHDDVPDEDMAAREGVAAIAEFVRPASEIADEDGPRRVIDLLMTLKVQYDGTTRIEQIGALLDRAYTRPDLLDPDASAEQAIKALGQNGLRPIRGRDPERDHRGRAVPRLSPGDGLWLLPIAVRALFRGSIYEGDRWEFEIRRLPGARKSKDIVRVGGAVGKCVWLPRGAFDEQASENTAKTPPP